MGKNVYRIYILSPPNDRRKKTSQVNVTKSQTRSRRSEEEMSGTVEISIVSASFSPHATFDSGVLYYLFLFAESVSISDLFPVCLFRLDFISLYARAEEVN